jgi:hypothetical protein
LGRIIDLLASAVSSLISRVRNATSQALTWLSTRAEAAWNGLKNLGAQAWGKLKEWGAGAWERLKNLGSGIWERLKDLGERVWQGLKSLGERLWAGLKSLAQRAWQALNRAWDWVKRKIAAAWDWLKRAWEAVKRAASRMWDWLKRKAKQALEWLKRKWEWLKGLIRKALAWLKAKWKWLKSLLKITIKIPDLTLCKLKNFKPWKFSDIHSGRLPIAKVVFGTKYGPVEFALFVQADAVATLGGTLGPCTLKNIIITLQPLISRYTAQADLHVPGTIFERAVVTGTIGGTVNWAGLIGLVGGGLEGTGTGAALASVTAKPSVVYDTGKIIATMPLRLEFCLMSTIDLDAFVTAKLIAGAPPSPPPKPSPIFPGPIPILATGSGGRQNGQTPALAQSPVPGPPVPGPGPSPPSPGPKKPPPEKILCEWVKRWHLKTWKRKECWNVGLRFTVISGPGSSQELDVDLDAKPVSLGEVVRNLFDLPPYPPVARGAPAAEAAVLAGVMAAILAGARARKY